MKYSAYDVNRHNSLNEDLQSIIKINERMPNSNKVDGIQSKWGKNLNAIREAFKGKVDDYKLMTTAILLENTANFLEKKGRGSMGFLNEATQPSDTSFFKRYAINLLSAVVPNLIAEDIVSVQPMLSRIGEIRFLRVLYGSDKAPVKKDQTMFSNYNLGEQFSQSTYTSNQVEGEEFLTSQTSSETFNLAWTPVIPSTLTVHYNGNDYTDDGQGNVVLSGGLVLKVNYQLGTLVTTGTFPAVGTEISCSYEYNNMEVPVNSPELTFRIVTSPIQAKSRKLKTLYSFDSALTV